MSIPLDISEIVHVPNTLKLCLICSTFSLSYILYMYSVTITVIIKTSVTVTSTGRIQIITNSNTYWIACVLNVYPKIKVYKSCILAQGNIVVCALLESFGHTIQ